MSDIAIPGSMAELTSEWLTEALKQAGGTQHATVTGFAPAAMDQSAGVVGSIGKIDLSYAEPVSGQPDALVVKLAASDPAVAAFSARLGLYSTEVGYYRHLAGGCPALPPQCFYVDISKRGDRFVLLLEALDGSDFGKWESGCTLSKAQLVVTALAKLHARHWGAEHLMGYRWLARPPVLARRIAGTVARGLPLCREVFPGQLPQSVQEQVDRVAEGFQGLMTEFSSQHLTLNHGDCHLNNMIVGSNSVRFYDWQTCSINNFAYDLAYFLNGNLADGVRAQHIEGLLDLYHTVLTSEGDARISRADVMEQYLTGSGLVAVIGAGIAGAFLSATPKGQRIASVLLSRISAAAMETDALARLVQRVS